MSSACSDEFAVRRLFVFIKDNLIFESLQDGLMQNKLLNEKEKEDYVCSNWTRHYWSERLLKLIIKKKKCKEFVAFLHQMSCHKHVSEKILEVHEKATEETQKAANGDVQKRPLILTYELLRRHFACLYMELEPREIADEMFQTGHISVSEHDNVTEFNQRYKRLRCLLVILRKKDLYAAFVCILQSLKYITVLDTLQKDRKLKNKPSDYSTCIQHNFILLQEDLPGSYDATLFMEHVLSPTNISDIDSCKGAVRKRSKLLKILLIKGKSACKEFFRLLEVDLKREDLIQEMKNKSAKIKSRGRPSLNLRHRRLNISCLQEHEDFLNEELEPLDIGDLLFEERAMEISAHDKITETKKRQKQVKYLLETLKENENDCFYFFLYILQREDFESVLEELTKPAQGALGAVSSKQMEWRLLHRVEKEPDDVKNEDIQMRLTVGGRTGHQVEQAFQDGYSSGTGILEEAILHGAVDIRNVSSGSVVLQLRPLTDQAVQTLLNVRDNNRLVEMIVGMLKQVNIASLMDGTEPLEIKVQVYKANPVDAISKTDDAELIKMRLKAHKNVLFSELEPRALAYVLSKSKAFDKGAIDSVLNADSCNDRVGILLSLVENGDSEVVKEFVTALKDLGYSSIVELIDPPDIHNKAENIRKIIISNYKNILEEMQIKLARETLSKCVGKVDEITEKISPKFGNRKQRMSNFLQFILQDDHNVIEFEKILRNNDLEDLLNIDENVQGEHIPTQGIEMTFVEDRIHSSSERVLFESVITLSHTVKSDRDIQQKVSKVSEETRDQQRETGAKQLHIDFEKVHLKKESPSRPQRLDMTQTNPDISLKGHERINFVSSTSIISDAEEDKSSGKIFTKNVLSSLKKMQYVDKILSHEERFDSQREPDLPSPQVRKSALYDEISKTGADYAESFALPKSQTANMKKRQRSATKHSLVDSQMYPTVARYAIHYIATSTDGQLSVSRLRHHTHQNPQLSNLSIDDLLRILDTYNSIFELEDTDRGKSHINVLLAFEFQVCDQPKKCGGYPTCRDLHICKYFIQNKCRQTQAQKCQFGHDLHSEHNLRILQEKFMDHINPQKLKEWIQKYQNRRSRTSRPPQICTFYNTAGGCSKNDTCQFLHLCSYYIRRSCKFGSNCSRSHALSSKRNIEILHGHGIDISETQDQILDILSKNRSQDTRNDNDESQRSGNRASAQCNKDVKETVKNMTPGAPFLVSEKSDRMTMQWNSIGDLNSDFEYQIQYKEVPDGQWIIHESAVSSDSSRAVITGLKSRTSYCFINSREGKEYPFSSETKKFDKPESPGLQMRYRSTVVKLGNPEIYRLPTKENIAARNETVKFKKFSLGSERLGINDKTIMLVGATGSGKSTLIDGFANYLFGVNWEDDFRFTLVDLEHEEKGRFKDQAVSQTEWITCYSIYPDIDVTTKLEYALHIVDTPGFGDTRGIEQDKKIMKQIEKMFTLPGDKGMACLDAVCFLVKAPDARLTTSQKYIMDAILSLFGKDMEDNICICITFAEAQEPPVLASLAKSRLPHKYYFKFNNSALFACNENRDNLASGFWKIGMESFDSFFERLDLMETKSLQLTKEVLKTRQDLENTVHNLQSWITAGIGKISALEEEKSIFKKYKKQIEENKDFVYEVTEQLMEKEDISGKGQHTTNCLTCNYTCHEKCSIPEDLQKSHCIAMDEHGNCKQCPGNCQWQLHHNTPYIIRWVSKKVKKNYREKLKLYTTAKEQVSSRTEVLQKMTKSVEDIEIVIAQLLDKITECNNWLKKIALKENPMNTADFIELMIESEKRERKPGYMLRIKVLEDCRRKAMIGIEATDFLYKAGQTRRGAMSINVPTSGSLISSMRSLMRL